MARLIRQPLPDPPPVYNQSYISQLAKAVNEFMTQATAPAEVVAARFIMTDPVAIPGDLPNTAGVATGTIYLKQVQPTPAGNVQAANPTGTMNATWTMMGLGLQFTATSTSTRIVATIDGQIGNTSTGETDLSLVYGTGTPPANGVPPPAGATVLGQPVRYTGSGGGAESPFAQTVYITGLTPGTTYWIDAAVKVTKGESIVSEVEITAHGLFDYSGPILTIVEETDV